MDLIILALDICIKSTDIKALIEFMQLVYERVDEAWKGFEYVRAF